MAPVRRSEMCRADRRDFGYINRPSRRALFACGLESHAKAAAKRRASCQLGRFFRFSMSEKWQAGSLPRLENCRDLDFLVPWNLRLVVKISTEHANRLPRGALMSTGFVERHCPSGKRRPSVRRLLPAYRGRRFPACRPRSGQTVECQSRDRGQDQHSKTFALSVVGPDGKAVPDVSLEVRGDPPVKVEQIREGRFLRQGKDGIFVRSTARGQMVLELPANLNRFEIRIEAPGYAPYWARWDSEKYSEPVPLAFRAS